MHDRRGAYGHPSLLNVFTSVALLIPICFAESAAQRRFESSVETAGRAVTQYKFDRWDDRDGLAQMAVLAIAQTTDGYLWLGTGDGLIRFDGIRFSWFNQRTDPILERAYFRTLAADVDGSLWGGTEFTGLIHMKDGKFRKYGPDQGLPDNHVTALVRDRKGSIWVGTARGLAQVIDAKLRVVGDSVIRSAHIRSLALDSAGQLWVSSSRGVGRMIGTRFELLTDREGPVGVGSVIAAGNRNGIWIANDKKLVRYTNGEFIRFGPQQGVPSDIFSLMEDDQGHVWLSGGAGVGRLSSGMVTMVPRDLVPSGGVMGLFADAERSIWAGTAGEGLVRWRATPITPIGPPEGISGKLITKIAQDKNGGMWFGTWGDGVNRVVKGTSHVLSLASGELASDYVFAIRETRDGAMWVGTNPGVSRIKDGRADVFGKDRLKVQVRSIAEDSAGQLWFGTQNGLMKFRPLPARMYTKTDGLASNLVVALLVAGDNDVWAGTIAGLSRIRDGVVHTYTRNEGLPDSLLITGLYEDRSHALWVTSSAGVFRMKDGRFVQIDATEGCMDNSVSGVLEDVAGRFWLTSSNGVYALDPIHAVDTGLSKPVKCKLYGRMHGLRSPEMMAPPIIASDGRIWLATVNGAAVLNPNDMSSRLGPPRVIIEEVLANGQRHTGPNLVIPAGNEHLDIQYSALTFVAPEKARFRYKLEGVDREWVEAGNRRTAFYTNVPPGSYRFRVLAANAEGEWNKVGASLTLSVTPFLHQTAWFRLGAGVAVVLALALAFRWRTSGLKERMERHRAAEMKYRESFEKTSDAIVLTDLNGRVTGINATAERLTGYKSSEASGMDVHSLLNPQNGDSAVSDRRIPESAVKSFELVGRDGARVPVEVSTYVVDYGSGPQGVQLIARDLRERTELEKQLRQAQKMEAIGYLAGGVAHDFNNLLTVISGNSALLLDQGDGRDHQELRQIFEAAERGAKLTQQLLVFGNKALVHSRAVDLNKVIVNLEPMLRRLIPQSIAIHTVLSEQPPAVHADPGQLDQVLMNLVLNARDAMPQGGSVTIETRVEEQAIDSADTHRRAMQVVVAVTDSGDGISEENMQHIFEPFFTTKEVGKGTGLGLSTVYAIVTKSGGSIRCSSEIGRGSTFCVTLPLVALTDESGKLAPHSTSVGTQGSGTILIAEDEAGVRSLITKVLRRQGYTVLVSDSGREALRVAAQLAGRLDLLVTDMIMPELDGRGLYRELSALRPGTPVLFISGFTNDELLKIGSLQQGEAFLGKPFTPGELAAAVHDLLGSVLPGKGNAAVA